MTEVEKGLRPFYINISLGEGKVEVEVKTDPSYFNPEIRSNLARTDLRFDVWARDKEHAVKIAADKRREWLVNKHTSKQ